MKMLFFTTEAQRGKAATKVERRESRVENLRRLRTLLWIALQSEAGVQPQRHGGTEKARLKRRRLGPVPLSASLCLRASVVKGVSGFLGRNAEGAEVREKERVLDHKGPARRSRNQR